MAKVETVKVVREGDKQIYEIDQSVLKDALACGWKLADTKPAKEVVKEEPVKVEVKAEVNTEKKTVKQKAETSKF